METQTMHPGSSCHTVVVSESARDLKGKSKGRGGMPSHVPCVKATLGPRRPKLHIFPDTGQELVPVLRHTHIGVPVGFWRFTKHPLVLWTVNF